jgi:hypothetical protein
MIWPATAFAAAGDTFFTADTARERREHRYYSFEARVSLWFTPTASALRARLASAKLIVAEMNKVRGEIDAFLDQARLKPSRHEGVYS